ncbi:Deaminated glutathione amidase [bioreactor metagenome]|uniref:Deaminated glutathione amidase n=1 Tax=bioreactor metagenome TaxID=1076179 RepID=A0A645ENF3_9ZZZZ
MLPEYFAAMGHRDQDKLAHAEALGNGPVQDFLADAARTLGLWIVGGTLPLRTGDGTRVTNSSLAFAPTGERVARYDKIHLFQFDNGRERYEEARVVAAGRQPVTLDIGARDGSLWRVGLSVCYDLRFPELYRHLAGGVGGNDKPVDLIVMPAAFTETTGRAHWEILLRARAIENQCYVLAVGQGGRHENDRETHGNSMVVGPWGDILDRKLKGPGVVIADFDPTYLAEVRASLPALRHRVL